MLSLAHFIFIFSFKIPERLWIIFWQFIIQTCSYLDFILLCPYSQIWSLLEISRFGTSLLSSNLPADEFSILILRPGACMWHRHVSQQISLQCFQSTLPTFDHTACSCKTPIHTPTPEFFGWETGVLSNGWSLAHTEL